MIKSNSPLKGILSNVTIDNYPIQHWNHYRLFDNWPEIISKVAHFQPVKTMDNNNQIPNFYIGTFTLPNKPGYPFDSFLKVKDWTKGVAFLNGHNLGRYWPVVGPQETLYAPSIYFRQYPQVNEIILFEHERSPCHSENSEKCVIQFVSKHIINGTTPQH